jgi:glycosyltransferase involved in cell wall biosynthesis
VKITYILSAPQMAGFLRGHLSAMKASGFSPIIISPEETPQIKKLVHEEGAQLFIAPMERNISLVKDVRGIFQLTHLLWKIKPEITVTIGPKAGLLGGVASTWVDTPCRIQTKWGIRLETAQGILRLVLMIADKIAASCAHFILCDSHSGKQRTTELYLAPAQKISVIANGSANGIDTNRFEFNATNQTVAEQFRKELGILPNDPLVGFVGRINLDKGIVELVDSWRKIKAKIPRATLAVIGENECKSSAELKALNELKECAGVKILGARSQIEGLFLAMDVLLLPSHREGFGVVVLEAAAMKVPTVGFKVTGMKDSVVNHQTGVLVELGDTNGLAQSTINYLLDPSLKQKHGEAGRKRVFEDFQQITVWEGYFHFFKRAANSRGLCTRDIQWRPPQ